MITLDRIVIVMILIWAFIYTISYSKWTWRRKNKLGAVVVFLIALIALILPAYSIFFREV